MLRSLVGSEMCIRDSSVAVLNMANGYNCGGGFERGVGSQEEYLFRNSTLSASLWPRRRAGDEREWSGRELLAGETESVYPFSPTTGIYSPMVRVFGIKDRPAGEAAHECAMLSVAAQDLRVNRAYNQGACFSEELTREKLRTSLRMAADHGHTAVVLGAIGCGAFRNPPTKVAEAFLELLSGEFKDVFAEVVFAIVKSEENLSCFEAVLAPLIQESPPQSGL
eukprot:TRINITY_DN50021_c0_g1_i1.p1 TRINITY_DN50021_c0_g1~~TRINITY_DN50021_c0_g1_i1.p1  ORF type:complete len:223 (-),score=52.02 TRINITY_DN50021_c0_g1_i1:313-981(-)